MKRQTENGVCCCGCPKNGFYRVALLMTYALRRAKGLKASFHIMATIATENVELSLRLPAYYLLQSIEHFSSRAIVLKTLRDTVKI